MKISEVTRRKIFDALRDQNVDWAGGLSETKFLARIYNLEDLPSSDHRFKNAKDDIWQHRVNNHDGENDWVFSDDRFELSLDDFRFMQFLCESVHPEVRPDIAEAEELVALYNEALHADGFEIVETAQISGHPVFIGRKILELPSPGLASAKEVLSPISIYISQQITRMETAINPDPALAIGSAKDLVETVCKTILHEIGEEVPKRIEFPKLVKRTRDQLQLAPEDIVGAEEAAENIKAVLDSLEEISHKIAQLRNRYGTGHGQIATFTGPTPRVAKLVVGAASTLAVFLYETHQERNS